jgi:hypothetical protein
METLPISEVSAYVMVESVLEPVTNKHIYDYAGSGHAGKKLLLSFENDRASRREPAFLPQKASGFRMVLQWNGRREYVIIDKGYQIMKTLVECYSLLIL